MSGEIWTHQTPWPMFGMAVSRAPDTPTRIAYGSLLADYTNSVEIVQFNAPQADDTDKTERFTRTSKFEHPYPATKIAFTPSGGPLLATSADYLRVWSVADDGGVQLRAKLDNNQKSEFCAPLTSFDWNEANPALVGTASIDTTCTMWDVETQTATTQLIAHDREVYDIAFARGSDVFASVGADGSLRLFDLRALEHSTILYECEQPLLRLAWNKQDPNYVATFSLDALHCTLIDVRVPSVPCAELTGHSAPVNGVAWAPHSSCHLCTSGDDGQALIWDVTSLPAPISGPMMSYAAAEPINQLKWSVVSPEVLVVGLTNAIRILKV